MSASHGIYEATAPSLSDGNAHQLQLDSAGNLKTTVSATGGASVKNIVLMNGNSPATAITTAQTAVTGLTGYRSMQVFASIQGATGGTLDIYIQSSPDAGTTWVDYAHFTQLAAAGAAVLKAFTVSKSAQQTTITTVGTGTSPALAAGTVLGGDWGDQLRVVCVAGASTSAGAAQVIKAVLSV